MKRQVSPKAIDKMKTRVRELTSRSKGWSFRQVTAALRRYLLGWQAYFRLAETPSVFVAPPSVTGPARVMLPPAPAVAAEGPATVVLALMSVKALCRVMALTV